jgi:cell division protein FtsL
LGFSLAGFLQVLVAVVLPLGFLSVRMMVLTVQDRVIRLEEQLRYDRLMPTDLRARIGELSVDQCVALRFANDSELPVLARKVLDEKLIKRKTIKQMVRNWKSDYLRA